MGGIATKEAVMARSLVPYFFSGFPEVAEDFFEVSPFTGTSSDVTISEDETRIFVETPLPGVKSKDIEVTFHNGVLCVKGSQEEEEEDKKKKFYRKAKSTFSYSVQVPGDLDSSVEPEAEYDKGIMKVSFVKQKKDQPKKIEVKDK